LAPNRSTPVPADQQSDDVRQTMLPNRSPIEFVLETLAGAWIATAFHRMLPAPNAVEALTANPTTHATRSAAATVVRRIDAPAVNLATPGNPSAI
jgi:hypothetical protein